jgi:hypothetical protein
MLNRLAAQRVVAAQFDYYDIGAPLHDPVDAAEATRRGVAADPGVDDLYIMSCLAKASLRHCWKCLIFGQTHPRGQAVPEYDDAKRGCYGRER